MQNTPSAMHEEGRGSTRPQLPRLNPREIATLLLPGTNVQVMDATDEQFEAMVKANDLHVKDVIVAWSFDDRVRFINAARKCGIDLFAIMNTNNSVEPPKTIQNNSAKGIDSELFDSLEITPQAVVHRMQVHGGADLKADIDSLLERVQKSSDAE